ncbi:MAG: hypothetical protein HY093_03155 [Candidatus Liptonbacteria bacterium]|nr:hypothetical protein [Candidatus Liptonbacteria bacterium]
MKNRSIKIINIITLASILIGGFWPLAATHSALTSNWTGLVYIDIDPSTGFGGYIIGEGLNGGFTATPVEQWPSGLVNLLINKALDNLTAVIATPTPGQQFTKGQKVPWQANYSGTVAVLGLPVGWTENLDLDSSPWPVGNVVIPSGYGTTASVTILLKYPTRLGTKHNEYDSIIIKTGDKYNIPPSILKSLVRQESGSKFNPLSYRYEPCIDYSWFSGTNPTIGLDVHPFHHFKLAGKDLSGNSITQGDQISTLTISVSTLAGTYSNGGLVLQDSNKDGNLTLKELWDSNDSKQKWSSYCPLSEANKNFTSQFLVSASYGLGQLLYNTAIVYGFDTWTEGSPARNIYDLFEPKVSLDLAAKKLISGYIKTTPSGNTCDRNQDWWIALKSYNGAGAQAEAYADSVCKIFNSGIYSLLE